MDNGAGSAFAGVEGLADNVLPALGQDLDRYVGGNHVIFDETAKEFVLGFRGGGKAHLNFLEAHPQKHVVKFQLLFQAHGDDQALIAVPQVHAAPARGFFDVVFFHPLHMLSRCGVVSNAVFSRVHSTYSFFMV